MSDIFVLDASVSLAWILTRNKSEEVDRADRALSEAEKNKTWVPALWHTEIGNVLLMAERHKVITEAQITHYLNQLSILDIHTDTTPPMELRYRIMMVAREYKLTTYDATYLDLALRLDATLATFDVHLAKAMHQAGGKVFE